MDPFPLLVSVCVTIFLLLGAARRSEGDEIICPCSEIPKIPETVIPPANCSEKKYRYKCLDGYVRKAGTSNLIKCEKTNSVPKWPTKKPTLICILAPREATTQTPENTVTTATDTPRGFNITTTITSASTSLLLTRHGSISASVATEKSSRGPTLSDFVRGTEATYRTSTSTAAKPSNNRRVTPHVSGSTEHSIGKTTAVMIVCASLVIICGFIGISCLCYRRRSRTISLATEEEKISMNPNPSGLVY